MPKQSRDIEVNNFFRMVSSLSSFNSRRFPMKARVVSDIHHPNIRDLRGDRLAVPKADVCICVGDITTSIDETISLLLRVSNHECI